MSVKTIVTLPDGTTVPLASLARHDIAACDGCGWQETPGTPLIRATVEIRPVSDNDGEGATISAHLCGREACQLSAMARHFEALWPLPETAEAQS